MILLCLDPKADEIRRWSVRKGEKPVLTHVFVGYIQQPWPNGGGDLAEVIDEITRVPDWYRAHA